MKGKMTDWQIGDWVKLIETDPPEYRQVSLWDFCCEYEGCATFWDFEPVPLTLTIFSANDWTLASGKMVLKGKSIRLGWDIRTHKFYIGYGELPNPVEYVHQVQHILRDCDLNDEADNFKLKTCNFQEK